MLLVALLLRLRLNGLCYRLRWLRGRLLHSWRGYLAADLSKLALTSGQVSRSFRRLLLVIALVDGHGQTTITGMMMLPAPAVNADVMRSNRIVEPPGNTTPGVAILAPAVPRFVPAVSVAKTSPEAPP